MPTQKIIPASEQRSESKVSNSRFIASISPAFSVEEAREFIERTRQEFSDASHNVPAFIIGHGASVTAHCNDDGEPPGTAGRPVLAVLQGSGMGDVVVVVSRYFGGTKLGTGGLVRAYSDAVRSVLSVVPRAEKAVTQKVDVVVPYKLLEQAQILVKSHKGVIVERVFAADVKLSLQFRMEKFQDFNKDLLELSHGSIRASIVETNSETILPLETQENS
ncbi:MAG: YigZ family protein [Anaerolineae bacterium]|nr:MAG: YigZ family protein [Anaerolineae bacterium]